MFLAHIKENTKSLKQQLIVIYYVYKNPHTKRLPKILIAIAIGYALSPIDLIPDCIPILGYLDDLIIVPALIALSIRLIPKEIMAEARIKALHEPFQLKKNWFFAGIIIFLWILLLIGIFIIATLVHPLSFLAL